MTLKSTMSNKDNQNYKMATIQINTQTDWDSSRIVKIHERKIQDKLFNIEITDIFSQNTAGVSEC